MPLNITIQSVLSAMAYIDKNGVFNHYLLRRRYCRQLKLRGQDVNKQNFYHKSLKISSWIGTNATSAYLRYYDLMPSKTINKGIFL